MKEQGCIPRSEAVSPQVQFAATPDFEFFLTREEEADLPRSCGSGGAGREGGRGGRGEGGEGGGREGGGVFGRKNAPCTCLSIRNISSGLGFHMMAGWGGCGHAGTCCQALNMMVV